MVKGISRQAVVVRPAEAGEFEQAIFVLAEDRAGTVLRSPEEMLSLAEELAASYAVPAVTASAVRRPGKAVKSGLWFAAGALASGLVWLASVLLST